MLQILIPLLVTSVISPAAAWALDALRNRGKVIDKLIRAAFEQAVQLLKNRPREEVKALFLKLFVTAAAQAGVKVSSNVTERAGVLFDAWWDYWESEEETNAREAAAAAGKKAEVFVKHLEDLAAKEKAAVGPDGRVHLEIGGQTASGAATKPGG